MSDPTENTIDDALARYLSAEGLTIWREPSARAGGKGRPDFVIRSESTIYGERGWSKSYADGMLEAIDYGEFADTAAVS